MILIFSISASVSFYASPFSTIVVGFLIDKYGRKIALLYSLVPSVIGYSLLYSSTNIYVMLLGQIFKELTMGASAYPVQVYGGECVMVHNVRWRNIFLAWISMSYSLGYTSMLLMANFFDYHSISAISATLCAILVVIFYYVIPESPTWLYRKGRTGDAEWSQKKLGIMQPILQGGTSHYEKTETIHCNLLRQMRTVTRPDVYKPIFILSIATALLSFCGTIIVSTYMIDIIDNTIPGESNDSRATPFGRARNKDLSTSYKYSLVSGVCMCLGSLVSSLVLPRMGLRKMLMTSKATIILGLVTLTYGALGRSEFNIFLRTAAVALLAFLMGLELGPRMSFTGDIFPTDAKGFASVPSLTATVAAATAEKMFPYLRVNFGACVFLFYAIGNILSILYVYCFLPEVVGRTLDEINREFRKEED